MTTTPLMEYHRFSILLIEFPVSFCILIFIKLLSILTTIEFSFVDRTVTMVTKWSKKLNDFQYLNQGKAVKDLKISYNQ